MVETKTLEQKVEEAVGAIIAISGTDFVCKEDVVDYLQRVADRLDSAIETAQDEIANEADQ